MTSLIPRPVLLIVRIAAVVVTGAHAHLVLYALVQTGDRNTGRRLRDDAHAAVQRRVLCRRFGPVDLVVGRRLAGSRPQNREFAVSLA